MLSFGFDLGNERHVSVRYYVHSFAIISFLRSLSARAMSNNLLKVASLSVWRSGWHVVSSCSILFSQALVFWSMFV